LEVVEECPGFFVEAALPKGEDFFEGGDHGAKFGDFGVELVDAMLEPPAFVLVVVFGHRVAIHATIIANAIRPPTIPIAIHTSFTLTSLPQDSPVGMNSGIGIGVLFMSSTRLL
jgi:hypothetical protein